MNALDLLLESLRLRSTLTARIEVGEPYGIAFPPSPKTGVFDLYESGNAILNVPGQTPIRLQGGDFTVVLNGQPFTITDLDGTPPVEIGTLMGQQGQSCSSGQFRLGGDGPATRVISGKFSLEDAETHPLWRMLPPVLVLRGEDGHAVDWLENTLGFLACEAANSRPGRSGVLDRLCDILFIQAVRGWAKTNLESEGWPAAMRDPVVGEALALIHGEPEMPWTVASLADRVALSRSSFADRFRRLTGESPMGYLSRWRMHQATRLLSDGGESVATVAEKVGYESEAAFAKAFKRQIGTAPGAYRRQGGIAA